MNSTQICGMPWHRWPSCPTGHGDDAMQPARSPVEIHQSAPLNSSLLGTDTVNTETVQTPHHPEVTAPWSDPSTEAANPSIATDTTQVIAPSEVAIPEGNLISTVQQERALPQPLSKQTQLLADGDGFSRVEPEPALLASANPTRAYDWAFQHAKHIGLPQAC